MAALKALLDAGADKDLKTTQGYSILDIAKFMNEARGYAVEALLEAYKGAVIPETGMACFKKDFEERSQEIIAALKTKTPFVDFMVFAQGAFDRCKI